MRAHAPRAALVAAFASLIAASLALADRYDALVPEKPERYVTDRGGIFAPGQAESLNAKLEQFERDTSNQILVWVDKKLPEGFTLEDFTVRAAQKWGPGQKKVDNGAILFVFTEDRAARIEVGYGLEGALPDVTAKRIIEDEMFPHFRNGDFPGGIDAASDAMMAAARGEYKGTGSTRAEGGRKKRDVAGSCFGFALFFGLFFVLPMILRGKRRFRTHGGRGWWTGGGGFGGFSGGGFGGGGGFSGGGGGFSGGGGSFGGGGASGRW